MSWAYPPYKPTTSQVLDLDRFNENLASYAYEVDGNLNEHNFASTNFVDTLISSDKAQPDIGMRIYRSETADDPRDAPASGINLPASVGWAPALNTAVEFNCPAGQLYINISFQFSSDELILDQGMGIQFAIELDGSAQLNSILGATDLGNETVTLTSIDPPYGTKNNSNPSFRATYYPFLCKGVYRVMAGYHKVRLVYRNVPVLPNGIPEIQWISNRETICLWTWS